MKEKLKNNKKAFIILGVFLILLIGVTIAYFGTTDYFENTFHTDKYASESEEVFTSPTNWKPGDTTPKKLTIKNTGDMCENVRVSFTESWTSANNATLPNAQNGNQAAIINFGNQIEWIYNTNDGYYYYNKNLLSNEQTSSLIKSVTFNPLIVNSGSCTDSTNGRLCTSTGNGYDDAQYELRFKIETIQCEVAASTWGYDPTSGRAQYAYFDDAVEVDLKLQDMVNYTPSGNDISPMVPVLGFKRATDLPTGFTPSNANTISAATSDYPIYAWYDTTERNIYYYTTASLIEMNENCSSLFGGFASLTDISGLQDINTDFVVYMDGMFAGCQQLTNLDVISHWDVSKAETMSGLFYECTSLTDISILSTWDTSNVFDMANTFSECQQLTSLNPISTWDTSNVTSMVSMFKGCSALTDVSAINDWDLTAISNADLSVNSQSNPTYQMFDGCSVYPTFTFVNGSWTTDGTFIVS